MASSDDELFRAIEGGDVQAVLAALSAGADANAIQSGTGWRPLHAAIEAMEDGGPPDTVELLLKHGAEVDGWDAAHDATPLLMAVFRGQRSAAEKLLAAGADANVVGGEGDSPLRWAAQQGDTTLARLLLSRGADRDIDVGGGISGMNALGAAARYLHPEMVRLLLEAGARPDAPDADGVLPIARVDKPSDPGAIDRWREVLALLGGTARE